MPDTEPAFSLPAGFEIGQVLTHPALIPGLGPLAAFTGTFAGHGFNTIFRPNLGSPTSLPVPPVGPADNVLELNLTLEKLSFSTPLRSVPNRGEMQPDIFLNGVPYLQEVTDITNPAAPVGIHLEPGLWMIAPPTSAPEEGATLARMASIPHGTTVCAQGTWQTIPGPPVIPPVSITPAGLPPFPSQTAAANDTWRVPQQLPGTITQAMLDDPNTVLRNAIAGQAITSTTIISVATNPSAPLFGGGTDNIAFLLGDPAASTPNAQTTEMTATFWIETVEHAIFIPAFTPGQPPLKVPAAIDGQLVPIFAVNPPIPILRPTRIVTRSTQIQYSQKVMLKFNGLLWPHVSVATFVPASPVSIPRAVWARVMHEPPQEDRHE